MATEQNFTDHAKVLLLITEVQDSEQDQREMVEEQKNFILLKDGQWDEHTVRLMDGRYRGTFDQVSPILDQISGELDDSQFAISVSPAGGGSSEDTAEVYAGMIRNIENISDASQIYSQVGKSLVMAGLDGSDIVQEHLNANTFDQDLIFKPVSDWYKSVWFDLASIKQDKSDAKWAVKLRTMPRADYDKKFPDGAGISIGDNTTTREADNKFESVVVGKIYYKKPIDIELVKMTSGAIYEKDKEFLKIQDELALTGEVVTDERTRKSWRIWTRLLDGSDWLTEAQETVFSFVPLVPAYGNYSILDTKNIYFGKTLKLMDAQRGLNFAMSSETEEVAMSPPPFIMMTREQAAGNDYSRMNIDRKAVRFFNHVDNQLPPQQMGGKMPNPGLQNSLANFQQLLQKTGNMDDPSMGQNPGLQSGSAISQLVTQSNNGNVQWAKAMEIGICHAYRICIDAIPRIYDGARQQRILGEDGVTKTVQLNIKTFDEETRKFIEINDLTKGAYDVSCSMGAKFKNQQDKASAEMISLLQIDPTAIDLSRDILYKNQTWPGAKIVAARARVIGINNGTIGEDEWTEEEAAEIQQAQAKQEQQEPEPDPNVIIAQAEMQKAQAETLNAQNKQTEIQGNQQLKAQELQLKGQELQLDVQRFQRQNDDKFNVDAANIQQGQQKIDQSQQKIEQSQIKIALDQQSQQFNQAMDRQAQQFNEALQLKQQQISEVSDAINNLKVLREASGIDSVVGVGNLENIKEQTEIVDEKLDDQ